MKVRRVVRPRQPVEVPSDERSVRILVVLAVVLFMLLPLRLTAIGPLTVVIVDMAGEAVPRACVSESWPAYSVQDVPGARVDTVAGVASAVVRADARGVAQLPVRTATASAFRRLRVAFTGRAPVSVTILGPGYSGTADLKGQDGGVYVVVRPDVQSAKLKARFARTCVP